LAMPSASLAESAHDRPRRYNGVIDPHSKTQSETLGVSQQFFWVSP
jgi:hypothetical protein